MGQEVGGNANYYLRAEYEPPASEIERTLADVWAEVLKIERVGRHDNFFALGGDSILSIMVISRAEERGLRISAVQIFQYQTIAEIARLIESEVAPDQK